jgi:YidC/Oxa1 family membrane protein insertase
LPEIRNPNQAGGTGQDRSLLVMMVVMIAVIFGIQYVKSTHPPAAPATPPAAAAPATAAPPAATATPAAAQAQPAAVAVPTVAATAETSTVIENELYRITFSNRGGQVTSWVLKRQTNNQGQPLDLVNDAASKLYGYPLSLYTYDPALNLQLASALFVPSASGNLQAPASLSFHFAQGNIEVTKTFTFGEDYVIHADTVVLRNGSPIRALLTWPAGFGDMETLTAFGSSNIDSSSGGHDQHIEPKKVSGGATLNGPFDFAGTSDQYFAAIFLPDQPADATLVTLDHTITPKDIPSGPGRPSLFGSNTKGSLPVLGAGVGDLSGHNQTRLFVGPKAIDVLKTVHTADGHNLESVLDFGFWGYIGKYLFLGLHFVHGLLPQDASNLRNYSWGWAIVLFTLLINLILLPLRITGMKSMLKMQRIQPGIDAIKAKFKNPKATDPAMAEMNAEIMAYQKEHGVNMFGGCIPSLIQLPLLFAFFTMMNRVVELRHAHFFWLHDLSAADPYHIVPITMVITSFLVQFYTPSPGVDPQQQKMMAFMMPAMSGWMTWNYASGLGVYWVVGNLIMIAQQSIMNNTALGKEIKEIAAARARRAAAGKTPPNIGSKPGPRTIQARR